MNNFLLNIGLASAILLSGCASQPHPATENNKDSYTTPKNVGRNYQSPCLQIALQNKEPAIKVGYGNGRSVSGAKQQALYDIANQLQVNVQGTAESHNTKTDGAVSLSFQQEIKSTATAILSAVEISCSDTNDPDGLYHFALRYDQRPLVDVFAEQLSSQFWHQAPGKIDWQGPSVILNSAFIKSLSKKLIDNQQTETTTLNVQLFRKNQQWQLGINGIIKPLEKSHHEQIFNWKAIAPHSLTAKLTNPSDQPISSTLRDSDDFLFSIQSKQSGYLSVFDIYEDGRVTKLRENLPIDNSLRLPEHQGSFSAGLLTPGEATRDHYIFILTKAPIDATAFRQIMLEENSSTASNNYSLNLFLFWLDQQAIHASTTLLITTVPR